MFSFRQRCVHKTEFVFCTYKLSQITALYCKCDIISVDVSNYMIVQELSHKNTLQFYRQCVLYFDTPAFRSFLTRIPKRYISDLHTRASWWQCEICIAKLVLQLELPSKGSVAND